VLLFFSGGECSSHVNKLLQVGVKNIQLSFAHLADKRIIHPKLFESPSQVLVSSGAFSLQESKLEDTELFVKEYVSFLSRYSDKIFAAAEFDATWVPGEVILEWRKKYFQPLAEKGLKIIYIWKPDDKSLASWEEMCRGGLGYLGIPAADLCLTRQVSLLQIARKYRTKVHAFGFEKPDWMVTVPYFSSTCGRWLNGEKFGAMFFWDSREMLEYRNTEKDARKRHKTFLELHGFDFSKVMLDDVEELGKVNAFAWLEFEKYVTRRTVLKQYWCFDSSSEPTNVIGWHRDEKKPATQEIQITEIKKPENPLYRFTDQESTLGITRSHLVRQKSTLCDNCYAADRCKFYEAGMVCKLNKEFMALSPSRNPREVLDKIKMLLGNLEERTNRALYFEAVDGGMPDKNATELVKTLLDYNIKLHNLIKEKAKTGKTVVLNGNDLLSKIFAVEKKVIDISPSQEEPQETEALDSEP
jgi:hypothetical protein